MDQQALDWGMREAIRLFDIGLLVDVEQASKWLAVGYLAGRNAKREFTAELTQMAAVARAAGC